MVAKASSAPFARPSVMVYCPIRNGAAARPLRAQMVVRLTARSDVVESAQLFERALSLNDGLDKAQAHRLAQCHRHRHRHRHSHGAGMLGLCEMCHHNAPRFVVRRLVCLRRFHS
ncbi:hypothetical protein ACIQMR_05430 [Streptomyces sp. NPDC091376]|uniref:hypothetical protein n=1 Tax=Streptomyces sp. NPDC091376 TaxID=3365994 RepID=UPI00382CFF33